MSGGVVIYTAAQAATVAQVARAKIDAACSSGALPAADSTPASTRRAWRILAEDLRDWTRAGMPASKGRAA